MKNKQSGIGNRARVKRFKHDGMIKKERPMAKCDRGEILTKMTVCIII